MEFRIVPVGYRLRFNETFVRARKEVQDKVGSKVVAMHEEIVAPWESVDWPTEPDFTVKRTVLSRYGAEFAVQMFAQPAESTTHDLSVWQLLNMGTDTRPMHVSGKDHPDGPWVSKTAPRQLFSGPGGGVTTGIGPPYDDGIEKREFDIAVGEAVELYADQIVMDAYEKVLNQYFI